MRSKPCAVCGQTIKCKPSDLPHRRTCSDACRRAESASARFWRKAKVGEACWEWGGSMFNNGYGSCFPLGRAGGPVLAHRFAYSDRVGPIPEGMCVLHRCDNRRCVRPDHLFLGTKTDNAADRDAKGRQARGEGSGMAKLCATQVDDIRMCYELTTITHDHLARLFNVNRKTISNVLNRRTWRHQP